MGKKSQAPTPILYLPNTDGLDLSTWGKGRRYLAYKICPGCGQMFRPPLDYLISEAQFAKRVCCSYYCANLKAKQGNRLKNIKIKSQTGGNGKLTPLPVRHLHRMLKEDWEIEYVIPTGHNQRDGSGYPTCYKLDLADPKRKIGIEVDGGSHQCPERRTLDEKKKAFLEQLGWKIYHITNKQVISLCTIYTCQDIPHILQEVF